MTERDQVRPVAEGGAVGRRLRDQIASTGPVPFALFMEEALYGADGYYAEPRRRIGPRGDFVTGSSLSPLFAGCTHRILEKLDAELRCAAGLLEVGIGTGAHLAEVAARARNAGAGRRLVGVDRMPSDAEVPFERIGSLAEVEPATVRGVVFSYELFDALPVHRLLGTAAGLAELHVGLSTEGDFEWVEGELSDLQLAELVPALPEGQIADVAPGWRPLYEELAARLEHGLLVTCDYGFERERLLDSRIRPHGTLACYREQHVHRNPFVHIGEQDLTAHVDFTTLREAGEAAGLETIAFTRQARWLTACGLFDELEGADQRTRLEAMHLLAGDGMGEEIRVLVQARGVETARLLDPELL